MLYTIERPVRATITLYPIGRPVRVTITQYPIGRLVRVTITLYPIGKSVKAPCVPSVLILQKYKNWKLFSPIEWHSYIPSDLIASYFFTKR